MSRKWKIVLKNVKKIPHKEHGKKKKKIKYREYDKYK